MDPQAAPVMAKSSDAARPATMAASKASTFFEVVPTAACALVISASVRASDSRRLQ
jgi:hypothetical protein